MPAFRFVTRRMSHAAARPYLLVGYLWFGLATYLLLAAGASHIAVALGAEQPMAAVVASSAAVATVLYGLVHVARGPRVFRVDVPLENLSIPSYTIVQLTDVHIGPM